MSVDDLNITSLRVERVMAIHHREILSIHADDTLAAVSRQFERKRTGIAVVVDDDNHVIGVVSLGDIVHAIGEHGANALYLPVRMIMTTKVVTCTPDEAAESAVRKMTDHGVRHLPVVENGTLKGCIEKIDALETLYDEAELDFTQLRNYIFKTGGRY
jgi:CBS domain-containing protein